MRKAPCDLLLTALIFSIMCLCTPLLDGQDRSALSAPLPTQLKAPKRIFISNEGVDGIASLLVDGDDGRIYSLVFNRAKSTGRYELVLNPAESDLVWTVQFVVPTTANEIGHMGTNPNFYPQLRLAIVDPKTRIVLWTTTAKIRTPVREKTIAKDIQTAVDTLIAKVTTLTTQSSATP